MPAHPRTIIPRDHAVRIALALAALVLFACASKPYEPQPLDSVPFKSRAQTQREGDFRVTAAVPSPEEAKAIFGIPVYKRRVQPIWLEIENASSHPARFAPVGTDRAYFPPLEVWYTHRKGFSKQGDAALAKYLHDSAMPRQIPAGATRSGFVFTNLSPGTKAFNVDLFGAERSSDHSFTFFIEVPGFRPDHAEVEFESLYTPDEIRDYDMEGLRTALADLPCCTRNRTGDEQGLPVGLAIIGEGDDVLHALLRAGWYETVRPEEESVLAKSQYLFDRPPDGVFRIQRGGKYDRNEMRVWLAPMRVGGEPIWLAQITHYVGQTTPLGRALFDPRLDPDIDDGRNYMLQIMWYSQSVARFGWISGNAPVPIEDIQTDFTGADYFTDGYRAAIWLSGDPVSLLETESLDWDAPPRWLGEAK